MFYKSLGFNTVNADTQPHKTSGVLESNWTESVSGELFYSSLEVGVRERLDVEGTKGSWWSLRQRAPGSGQLGLGSSKEPV